MALGSITTSAAADSAQQPAVELPGDDVDSFRQILIDMAQQDSVQSLMELLAERLASTPEVKLVRVFKFDDADICDTGCPRVDACEVRKTCMHLVASAGTALMERPAGETDVTHGNFRRIPLNAGPGVAAAAGEAMSTLNIQVESEWEGIREWAQRVGVQGFVAQPIISDGRPLGQLAVMFSVPTRPDHTEWLRIYADAAGAAITRMAAFQEIERLGERLKRDNEQLRASLQQSQAFLTVAQDLTGVLAPRDRYQRLLDTVSEIVPLDAAAMWRVEGAELVPVVSHGIGPRFLDVNATLDEPAFKTFIDSPHPVRLSGDALPELSFYPATPESPQRDRIGVLVGSALRRADKVVGLLTLSARDRHAFDDVTDDTIEAFAALAAAAMQTAHLIEVLESRAERGEKVASRLQRDVKEQLMGPLLGDSPAVVELRARTTEAGASHDAVFLVGPHGAGKDAVARAIHDASERAHMPFIRVDGNSLRTGQNQSTLFGPTPEGRECRAPTADSSFGLAQGGTLYVHGVSNLTNEQQRRLMFVIRAVGAMRDKGEQPKVDVRIIASAWSDPAAEVRSGHLDPELHKELSKGMIVLPALYTRRADISTLVHFYARDHARRLGKRIDGVSEEGLERLRAYHWPGNIGELRNIVERLVINTSGPLLEVEDGLLDEGIPMGRYRLIERLGQGGMGEVWRAKHQLLARPAAVKLIRHEKLELGREDDTESRRLVQRFQREAQATAGLRSPHTVQLYDFGVNDEGIFYYVMELLDGMDLESMVRQHGPVSAERVVYLLDQVCHSLIEAHEAGLVHRDIKPANLFVGPLGPDFDFVKVLDFGMVKSEGGEDETALSMEGQARGTPAYMAPEMALGEVDVDGRADLYALGCVAFWLLTGRLVFEERNPLRMMMNHLQKPAPRPSDVAEVDIPAPLEELVMSLMAKLPGDRPASARVLREQLRAIPLRRPWDDARATRWWELHEPDATTR